MSLVCAKPLSEPMLKYYWFHPYVRTSVTFNKKPCIQIQENAFEDVCKMLAILSQPQCVKVRFERFCKDMSFIWFNCIWSVSTYLVPEGARTLQATQWWSSFGPLYKHGTSTLSVNSSPQYYNTVCVILSHLDFDNGYCLLPAQPILINNQQHDTSQHSFCGNTLGINHKN